MGNRPIVKVPIDSVMLLQYLKDEKISVRKLAERINYSERQLRTYIKDGLMPEGIVRSVSTAISKYDWLATSVQGGSFVCTPFGTSPIRYRAAPSYPKYYQYLLDAEIKVRNALLEVNKEKDEELLKPLCYAHCSILEAMELIEKKGEKHDGSD